MSERLTDKRVSALRPLPDRRFALFDSQCSGLAIRVTEAGVKSWSVMYRLNGKIRRDTLGAYPAVSLARARTLAAQVLERVEVGKDPRQVEAEAKAAEASMKADTVSAVAKVFFDKYAAQRRSPELKRILERDMVDHWGERPISEITRRDVIKRVDEIADRAPVVANRALAHMKVFFGWALDRDIIPSDPTDRVKKPTRETSRERVLTDNELRAFWVAAGAMGYPFGQAFKLLALTAQRRDEIASLQWSEINTDKARIELAGSRYKNGKPHTVPLSKAALEIIEKIDKIGDEPTNVFTTNAKTPVSGFSKAKATLDEKMLIELRRDVPQAEREKVKLAPWVIHDLRRTARTNFSKLGISTDIAERILGHTMGGVRGVYDRHSYLPQMADALERWAVHLTGIVDPKPANVVPIKRKTTR